MKKVSIDKWKRNKALKKLIKIAFGVKKRLDTMSKK